jgi:uncharacterized membrane protein YhaH (DUF805 family)
VRWSSRLSESDPPQPGSEGGAVLLDDEHQDGARITLEAGTRIAPFAITCGIYVWMMHTRYFRLEDEARKAFHAMKRDLGDIIDAIPLATDPKWTSKWPPPCAPCPPSSTSTRPEIDSRIRRCFPFCDKGRGPMLTFLFSPEGRVSRKAFWLSFYLPYFVISIGAAALDFALFEPLSSSNAPLPVFQVITTLFFLWPSIAVPVKRLHDRGMTGWWIIAPVPILIVLAVWYFAYGAGGAAAQPENLPLKAQLIFAASAISLVFVFLYLVNNIMFLRGQKGPNKYGPDPLGDQADTFN